MQVLPTFALIRKSNPVKRTRTKNANVVAAFSKAIEMFILQHISKLLTYIIAERFGASFAIQANRSFQVKGGYD